MATVYSTKDGDVLDAICRKHYGTEAVFLQVLNANPGLSNLGAKFSAGVEITLPDIEIPKKEPEASLWD